MPRKTFEEKLARYKARIGSERPNEGLATAFPKREAKHYTLVRRTRTEPPSQKCANCAEKLPKRNLYNRTFCLRCQDLQVEDLPTLSAPLHSGLEQSILDLPLKAILGTEEFERSLANVLDTPLHETWEP